MDIRLQSITKNSARADCLIIPAFAGELPLAETGLLDAALAWLRDSGVPADHAGKKDQITVCYGPEQAAVPRVLLLGLGPRESATLDAFRLSFAAAVRRCVSLRLARPALLLDTLAPVAAALGKSGHALAGEAGLAAQLAAYRCTAYRSAAARAEAEDDDAFFTPEALLLLHGGRAVPAALDRAVRVARAEGAGISLARDLVNGPANVITPARMAEEAQALAKRHGFACTVLRRADMDRLGMGALTAVADGSHREPRFIVLEHAPKAAKKDSRPLVLIGKGITFDTGGISLKPAAGMENMKGDMAGAAAVLGAFEALGRMSAPLSRHVVGLMPCVENMPGGGATRPGDIVTTLSGRTVEIINTDAEGRLILCDALTYAQKNWNPSAMVDLATLTGACVVALGPQGGGLFCDDAALREQLLGLGAEAGDLFWPMPLWENLRDNLKSSVADMTNVGSREGGAIIAALFLKSFVSGGIPWAHLDIAGPGHSGKETPLCTKGGTGFGVRTLYALARQPLGKTAG